MRLTTRGWRHAAHGNTPAAWSGCIPMTIQQGDVAVYWQSPAGGALPRNDLVQPGAYGREIQ
jgi:hypothetical protein